MDHRQIRHRSSRNVHRYDARVFVCSGAGRRSSSVCCCRHAIRDDVFAVRLPFWAAAETTVRRDSLETRAVGVNM
jgi:hypothetical protein